MTHPSLETPHEAEACQQGLELFDSLAATAAADVLGIESAEVPDNLLTMMDRAEPWLEYLYETYGIHEYPDEETEVLTIPGNAFAASAKAIEKLLRRAFTTAISDSTKHEGNQSKKSKRSTQRGEAKDKLISALTKHHEYTDGSCLNLAPVGNNELARLAEVSISTASKFFNKQFGGHAEYRAICGNITNLVGALKLLNQEYSPQLLYGAKPPNEDDRDDED